MRDRRLTILMPTDVFPPKCGGAGWSAHALARALQGRGHTVEALVPRRGQRGKTTGDTLGVPTITRGYFAPGIPFVLNYVRHERLWPALADDLAAMAAGHARPLLIHAQHVQVAPAAAMAGRRLGIPVVVTVRDHWPWDYFATGLHADRVPLPTQSWATLATDLPARLGVLRGAAALLAIPYMRAHLRRRQEYLRQADAVVAPSGYIAERLRAVVDPARIHIIPNMVDLTAIERTIAQPPATPDLGEPFLLFVGKLERNKGAHLLPGALRAMRDASPGQRLPQLVIAGDGGLKPAIAAELQSLGVRARFLEWVDHDEVLRLMARCALLLYPSAWGEPLTRVLLEACACGAPSAAMPTGGTPDIVSAGVNGVLAATPAALGAQAADLLSRPELLADLRAGARRVARERFAVERVVGRVEQLYDALT